MMFKSLIICAVFAIKAVPLMAAEASWPDLKQNLYEDRALIPAGDLIRIDAPYRTADDARTQISATIDAPAARMLNSVTLILDENPMPVSAVFNFDRPVPRFFFDVTMRVNGPTPLHVVAETTDGQLFVAETFVKTSGLGACSAPPGTDPDLALATLGEMNIEIAKLQAATSISDQLSALANTEKQVDLDISHPSHSGLQMDQISLLFIPMRYVDKVEIDLDNQRFVDVTGSISLSENPRLSLSVPGHTQHVGVTMTDTDGTVAKAEKHVAGF